MLTEICQYLRNWFVRDIMLGEFGIEDGVITADGAALPLLTGQYYRIVGSIFNDGVHKYGDATDVLTDEPTFSGAVWAMAMPPEFLALAKDISDWSTANADAINSPYNSESFGGYSYSVRSGNSADGEISGVTWQNQFKARLNPWRKI